MTVNNIAAILIASVLVSECTGLVQAMDAEYSLEVVEGDPPAAKNGMGLVCFVWQESTDIGVFARRGGNVLTPIKPGTYSCIDAWPGEHSYEASSDQTGVINMVVEADKIHYVRVRMDDGGWGRPAHEMIPDITATTMMRSLKQIRMKDD